MPFYTLRALPLRLRSTSITPCLSAAAFTPLRTFTTTGLRAIKEDSTRGAEHFEQKKQEQLRKQEKGEGHWHEELASGGEASVKADRQEVKDDDQHIEDL